MRLASSISPQKASLPIYLSKDVDKIIKPLTKWLKETIKCFFTEVNNNETQTAVYKIYKPELQTNVHINRLFTLKIWEFIPTLMKLICLKANAVKLLANKKFKGKKKSNFKT